MTLRVSQTELDNICRNYRVMELSVFGSVARGDARPDSDIDVLVEFDPKAPIGFLVLARLTDELKSLFGRPVDVVTKRGLHPRIRDDVLREAEVIFAA